MVNPYVRETRPGIVKNWDIYWRDDVEKSPDESHASQRYLGQEALPQQLKHEAGSAKGGNCAIEQLVPAIDFWGGQHDIDVCWDSRLIPAPCDIVIAKADLQNFFETNTSARPSTTGLNADRNKNSSAVAVHAANDELYANDASTDTTEGEVETNDEYPAARGRAQHSVLDWKDFLIDCARVR